MEGQTKILKNVSSNISRRETHKIKMWPHNKRTAADIILKTANGDT